MTTDASLRCPALACGGTMLPESAHGVTVDRCDRCAAVWFDAHELDGWLAAFYPELKPTPEHRMPRRGIGGRPCPRCHRAMETAGWTDLVVDRCPECHGIFAEAREVSDMEEEPVPAHDGTPAIRLKNAMVEAGWTMLAARAIAILVISVFG